MKRNGISCKVDDGGSSIGRRYARTDEIGIPFGITIDKLTIEERTVTLREARTTQQVRIKVKTKKNLLIKFINICEKSLMMSSQLSSN